MNMSRHRSITYNMGCSTSGRSTAPYMFRGRQGQLDHLHYGRALRAGRRALSLASLPYGDSVPTRRGAADCLMCCPWSGPAPAGGTSPSPVELVRRADSWTTDCYVNHELRSACAHDLRPPTAYGGDMTPVVTPGGDAAAAELEAVFTRPIQPGGRHHMSRGAALSSEVG